MSACTKGKLAKDVYLFACTKGKLAIGIYLSVCTKGRLTRVYISLLALKGKPINQFDCFSSTGIGSGRAQLLSMT